VVVGGGVVVVAVWPLPVRLTSWWNAGTWLPVGQKTLLSNGGCVLDDGGSLDEGGALAAGWTSLAIPTPESLLSLQ